jgi:hypothetical protein
MLGMITSKMSRKHYRRHTKSAHNTVRDWAFETAISKSIAGSKATNLPDSDIPEARFHHAKVPDT